jgi:serine/threonine-protein kinase
VISRAEHHLTDPPYPELPPTRVALSATQRSVEPRDGPPEESEQALARKIGSRYTAHQVLGRGSAGTVWLGEGPEGPVAIKLLREDLASDQDLVGRFVQERTALLSLDHPHIVGIRDLVVDGADLALVMDLVRGTDLRSRLERERRLTPAAAVAVAADVADGLAAAHAAGVVHRDVKPENVLLDSAAPAGPGGAPPALLTDFGIARLVDTPRRTRATRIIGTPDYLAPEIIEGLPPRASVDIYALATVLYELLAGFTPFGGGHPGAVLRRHVTEAVRPLPGLPAELDRMLTACLAKAPASRLTAGELGAGLRDLLPRLVGMPALDVAEPGAASPERAAPADPQDAAEPPLPPAPPTPPDADRRRGAGPLVRGSAPDSSRDTHTSIKLPTPEELAGYGAASRAAAAAGRPASPRHRSVSAAIRQRRIRLAAAAAAALAVAGIGGWSLASAGSSGSGGGTGDSRDDTPPDPAASTASTASTLSPNAASPDTPAAPTAGADAPQSRASSPAVLPQWSAFQGVPAAGARLTGGPRALVVGSDTYVFARGEDKNVWYVVYDGSGYGRWHKLTGIHVQDDPAVVAARPGRIDLFALGTDHLLYRRTLAGGAWNSWSQVDERTHFDAAPAAASSAPGRIDLVGRVGGDLVTASLVGSRWNAWAVVPTAGRITAAPALVSRAPGALDAFVVRKADGAVLQLPYSGGAWRPSTVVEGLDATSRPDAVATGGRLYAFASGGQAAATSDLEWAAAPLPGAAADRACGAAATSPHDLEIFTRTKDGRLSRATASV